MQETKKKSVKFGQIKKGKFGSYISLGNAKNKDPKYNYTVMVKVLNNEGVEVYKGKNPSVRMLEPNEKAPDFIIHDLVITLQDE